MSDGLLGALAADDGYVESPLVYLLGHPRVTLAGREIRLADRGLRLLAYVALNDGVIDRRLAAATLWPDDDYHAAANLRTALWRVNAAGAHLVDATRTSLRLAEGVHVDTRLLGAWSARVISGSPHPQDLCHGCWDLCRLDLLPGWYDEWVVGERERLRQRLLHALEMMTARLLTLGRCAEAVDVALLAVSGDPLRESAQEMLIRAYLAEGNRDQAFRAFARLRAALRRELGVEPSHEIWDRLQGLHAATVPARVSIKPARPVNRRPSRVAAW